MNREIYITKAEIIERYSLSEKRANSLKEIMVFDSKDGLINYFKENNDPYALQLRKRGERVIVNVDINNGNLANFVIEELKKIGFRARIMRREIKK